MSEVSLNPLRRKILEKCRTSHGDYERHWDGEELNRKAIAYLITQGLLKRELGDGHRGFTYRLKTTDRGEAALMGAYIAEKS